MSELVWFSNCLRLVLLVDLAQETAHTDRCCIVEDVDGISKSREEIRGKLLTLRYRKRSFQPCLTVLFATLVPPLLNVPPPYKNIGFAEGGKNTQIVQRREKIKRLLFKEKMSNQSARCRDHRSRLGAGKTSHKKKNKATLDKQYQSWREALCPFS